MNENIPKSMILSGLKMKTARITHGDTAAAVAYSQNSNMLLIKFNSY